MGQIEQSILESMEIIADESIKGARFDYTKRGSVISVAEDQRTCMVEIDGAAVETKVLDGASAEAGDVVLVGVIQNNFSDRYIIGKLGKIGLNFEIFHSAGILETFPAVVDNLNGTFDIGEADVALYDNPNHQGVLERYTIPAQTNVATPINSVFYVVADYNTGNPIYRLTEVLEDINESDIIPVLTVYNDNNAELHFIEWDTLGSGLNNKIHKRLVKTQRFGYESGFGISEASTPVARTVVIEGGTIWIGAVEKTHPTFNSSTDSMHLWSKTAGNWSKVEVSQYNNTQYQGASGLETLNPQKYTVNWVYKDFDEDKDADIVLSTNSYTSIELAAASAPPDDLPDYLKVNSFLVGRIIVVRDGTTAAQIDSAFRTPFVCSPVTDHNQLGNIQGGVTGERYHLSGAQVDQVNVIDQKARLDLWNNVNAAGRLFGGEITNNADGTVAIAAGGGMIKSETATPEQVPTALNQGQGSALSYVSWDAIPSFSLVDNAYNFIYYHGESGEMRTTTDLYSLNFTKDFTIGRAYRSGSNVVVRLCGTNAWNFNRRYQLYGEEVHGVEVRRGSMILGTSGLNIIHNGGILWAEGINRFTIEAFDSSTTDTFSYWYGNNTNGYVELASQSEIDNTRYYDGTNLSTLTPNRYGVHWVYVVHNSSVHVVYGSGNYTLSEAQASSAPSQIPGLLDSYATLIGRIIIQRDAIEALEVASTFETVFTSSSTSIHNELAGRSESDSHPINAITSLQSNLDAKQDSSEKGQPEGYASLDHNGKVLLSELPDTTKQKTSVVLNSTERNALTGMIEGDKAFETSTGDSYIWNGTSWTMMADADWENVDLDWANVVNKPSPTLTLSGDASGSATFTSLGNATLNVAVADDSHNHIIGNIDGLQDALNAKLSRSGGTMTGDINFSNTNTGVVWSMNTDGAYVKFFNTGDSDTNSRLEYATNDNDDEYHRWLISNNEKMSLKSDGLRVANTIWEGGTTLGAKYLGIGAKAADSDKLDGLHASSFVTHTEITNYSINPRFGDTIGMSNDSAVLYFNDSNNEDRTNYWAGKDGFYIRGDGNLTGAVVLKTGNLEIDENIYAGNKIGSGSEIRIAEKFSMEYDASSNSVDFKFV